MKMRKKRQKKSGSEKRVRTRCYACRRGTATTYDLCFVLFREACVDFDRVEDRNQIPCHELSCLEIEKKKKKKKN